MKGFTLIELVIYIAIVSVVLGLSIGFVWNIIDGENTSAVMREVQQNGRQAFLTIKDSIQKANGLNSISATAISLAMDDSNLNPTLIELVGDTIQISQGSNGPYDLTNQNVKVTNLAFTDLSYFDQSATISIEMSVEYDGSSNLSQYQSSVDFKSTVSMWPVSLPVSQTLVLRVQLSGDENGLSQYPNSQQHWDKVVEDPSDDDLTYVYRNGSNQRKDLYEIEDTALSADLIKEVVIYFNCKKVASAGIDGLAASFVKTNNQTFDGQTNMITDTYALYAQSYSVNPNTAAEWTWSEINNLQIGVSLNTTGNNTNSARCTQVWAEVESVSSF